MNAPSTAFAVDPDDPRIPDDFPLPAADAGEVVLLMADADARGSGWPARAATELARLWTANGLRVFLADGDLADAPLHGALGTGNPEGLSDVILHGASPGRVANRVEDGGFLFASAGTVVADPAAAYAHRRWSSVLSAFRESGTVFLLYLPAEAASQTILEEGDRILRLAASAPVGGVEPGVTVLHPPGPAQDEVGPEAGEPEVEAAPAEPGIPASSGVEEAVPADAEPVPTAVVESEGDGTGSAEPAGAATEAAPGAEAMEVPPAPVRSAARSRRKKAAAEAEATRRRTILLVILVVVAVLALLGDWLGYIDLPGFSGLFDDAGSYSTGAG